MPLAETTTTTKPCVCQSVSLSNHQAVGSAEIPANKPSELSIDRPSGPRRPVTNDSRVFSRRACQTGVNEWSRKRSDRFELYKQNLSFLPAKPRPDSLRRVPLNPAAGGHLHFHGTMSLLLLETRCSLCLKLSLELAMLFRALCTYPGEFTNFSTSSNTRENRTRT